MKQTVNKIFFKNLSMGILSIDKAYKIIVYNDWLEKHSGLNADEVLGKSIFDVFPEIRKKGEDRFIVNCIEQKRSFIMSPLIHRYLLDLAIMKNGQNIQMLQEVKLFPVSENGDGDGALILIKDLTEQLLHEKELNQKTEILNVVRKINRMMVNVTSEEMLFSQSVRILSEIGDVVLVWAARLEKNSKKLCVAGFDGIESDRFNHLIKHDDDFYNKIQLTQRALQTGTIQAAYRWRNDPGLKKHLEIFEPFKFNSAIAIPLKNKDHVFGVINIHKKDHQLIPYETIDLFKELADDISLVLKDLNLREQSKRAQTALRDSERRYRDLYDNAPDMYLSIDVKNLTILDCNRATLNELGYEKKEILGRSIFDMHTPEHVERAKNILLPRFIETGSIKGEFVQVRKKDGTLMDVLLNASAVYDKNGNVQKSRAIWRDVTKIKKLQAQLMESYRLATTGKLATFVAHDINSPLQGILSLVDMIKDSNSLDEEHSEYIKLIEKGFDHIQTTVKKLLELNRPEKETKSPVNLNKMIQDVLLLNQNVFRKNRIKINVDLCRKIPSVLVSPQQLTQVFLNLINNAVESMTKTSVEDNNTGDPLETYREISISTGLKEQNIITTVSDTGPGIDAEDIDRIFDPFFTKKKKMGIGAGLSISYNIIMEHKGSLKAANSPGGGAVFTIILPVKK